MNNNKIRILLVDDHDFILKGVIATLNEFENLELVSCTNCDDAFKTLMQNVNSSPFDIVFADLSFDNKNEATVLEGGEDLIRKIQSEKLAVKVGVITGHSETNRVFNVICNLKPSAYILKNGCDAGELRFAINRIMAGEKYYTHEVHQKIMKRTIVGIQMDEVAIQILKELPKHPKISNMVGHIKKRDGNTLSLRSIDNRLGILRADLNANNNVDLLLKAKELGIID